METIPPHRTTTDRPRYPWKIFWLLLIALTVGGASLLFAYLCWKRGLEAAMPAHFSIGFVLHVIGPIFFRG